MTAIAIAFIISSLTIPALMPLKSSFDLKVFSGPRPVVINGKSTLVYELHITNFSSNALTLKCVSVLDAQTEKQIMSICDDELSGLLSGTGSNKRTINSLVHTVVYFNFEISKPVRTLKHRVQYEDSNVVDGAEVSLNKNSILILDPPLAGGPWAAIYSGAWERGHRRVFYAVDGEAHIPGRFAIDWMKLDEQGHFANGDEDQIKNWYGYGTDVLAVADSEVAAIRDNIKESETISGHQQHKLEDASGNYIILDLGNGYFAFYEHLKPGSIRVKPGERVRTGQGIAALGFTGDSTGPHLHFHIADRNSLLTAEGVPYVLKKFKVIGSYKTMDGFGKKMWDPNQDSSKSDRTSEFPGSNFVVILN